MKKNVADINELIVGYPFLAKVVETSSCLCYVEEEHYELVVCYCVTEAYTPTLLLMLYMTDEWGHLLVGVC